MTTNPNETRQTRIEATYKAKDVEEIIDIWYYRPMGYALAVGAYKLKISPNTISVIGMFIGILGGHLFFYDDLMLNLLGVLCWMGGQAFDGADGQLARMTNQRTKMGRVLDGLSDSFKFLSVYIHIVARIFVATGSPVVIIVGLLAMWCHSAQSAFADYYRNLYLFFVYDPNKGELDQSDGIAAEYAEFSWSKNFWKKLLWFFYIPYTNMQEKLSGSVDELRVAALNKFGDTIPQDIKDAYRDRNKSNVMWYNALTTNTRMMVMYASLVMGNLWIYLIADLTYFNLVLIVMRVRQDRLNKEMMELVQSAPGTAATATTLTTGSLEPPTGNS
jgi:phosphatidylglycerophosphate synthase